jgi:hypothetical protein
MCAFTFYKRQALVSGTLHFKRVEMCTFTFYKRQAGLWSLVVIDRKRNFLFRPKTNIRQENAAEYSADNEYSAQEIKCGKNVEKKGNFKKHWFLGMQLQV